MSCEFTEKVSLLIDGELSPAELHEVERHLLACAECRQARADFVNLRQQITAYPVLVDINAQRRALASILGAQGGAGRATPAAGWGARLRAAFAAPRFNPAWAAAFALLVVGVAVAVVFYRNNQRHVSIAGVPTNNNTRSTQPAQRTETHTEVASAPNANQQQAQHDERNTARGEERPTVADVTGKRVSNQPGAQSAAVKSSREQRVRPERLPQARREAAPAYVAVNATTAAVPAPALNRSADAETLTARHVEQAELLLRTFRNARADAPGAGLDLSHERRRAQQLLYQNIVLRREAVNAGNAQVASLLDSLEPILLDIANLPAGASAEDVGAIKERVQRKNLVALLQVNSTALARAYE